MKLLPSMLLGDRALTVFAACAASLRLDGDVAECGVADGDTARSICELVAAIAPDKVVHLFDTFATEPIGARNNLASTVVDTHAKPTDHVRNTLGVFSGQATFIVGLFKNTLPRFINDRFCFVHADGDLRESTEDIIAFAERVVVPGGVVVFDDYGTEWTGVTSVVDTRLSADRWATYTVQGYGQLVAIRKG